MFGCAPSCSTTRPLARGEARRAGQPSPKTGELSTRLTTEAKRTAEQSWPNRKSGKKDKVRDAETMPDRSHHPGGASL